MFRHLLYKLVCIHTYIYICTYVSMYLYIYIHTWTTIRCPVWNPRSILNTVWPNILFSKLPAARLKRSLVRLEVDVQQRGDEQNQTNAAHLERLIKGLPTTPKSFASSIYVSHGLMFNLVSLMMSCWAHDVDVCMLDSKEHRGSSASLTIP